MKKIYVGIDISKEKCNLCYRSGLDIVREEECSNEVKVLKKAFKSALKALDAAMDEVLICAEYTGRYIYPLTIACQELDLFLWLDDPTRIKNSMGLTRGKNDAIDATREFLLTDKKRYQAQLSDQKRYMAPGDFKQKNSRWKKVIKSINEQIAAIDAEIEALIAADPVLTRQKELLVSIDGVGDRIAINMIAITGGFTRFQNARQFCSFAGLTPYKYDSGTSVRSKAKISKRSNQTMKALLHMSAVNVVYKMRGGEYKEYFERKTKEGKHVMCVLNVIRAKLVHRMFSVIRRETEYTKQYKPAC